MNQPYSYVALKKICNFEKGVTGISKAVLGDYPLVTTGPERRSHNSFQFDTKAVCIPLVSSTGHGHASLNYVHYQEGKFALGTILVALTAKDEDVIDTKFLHLYLSHLKDSVLVPLMSGAANVTLSVNKIKDIEVPLPPIKIQREIICKVNIIVAEDAFLRQELSRQQTLLKKLRQQILQEAVEGKLTADWRAQNPDVEPASELLARIQAEKAQLVKAKKISKQNPLPPISEEEKPFALPDGWAWCRLGEMCFKITDGTHHSPTNNNTGKFKYITAKNIKEQGVSIENITYVSEIDHAEIFKRCDPKYGDLLLIKDGSTTGLSTINNLNEPFSMLSSVALIKIPNFILNKYILHSVRSSYFYSTIRKGMSGVAITRITLQQINSFIVAIPPLPEQKAIVAKVEKLLSLCDQLEHEISQNQGHAEQLMQAVLSEAFSQRSEQTTQPAAVPVKNVMKQGELFSRQPVDQAQFLPLLLQAEQQGSSTEAPSFPCCSS